MMAGRCLSLWSGLALMLCNVWPAQAHDDGAADCLAASEPYLSLVDTMGLHVVCVETPWRVVASSGEVPESVSVTVFRNSLRSGRESRTLTTEDVRSSASWAPETLVAQLTPDPQKREAQKAQAMQENGGPAQTDLAVGLFSIGGRRVLTNEAFFGSGEKDAAQNLLFAFDGGRWLWPPVRIGHQWNVTGDDGRKFQLKTLSLRPTVFEVSDFLNREEAQLVRDLATPTLARSGVATTDGQDAKTAKNVRTSSNTFIDRGSRPGIVTLEERVHRLTRTWYDEGEHIQVVRYESAGQQMYEAHWDYFNPNQYRSQPDVVERMDLRRRNRMATLFWYINTLPEGSGGETFFPRALDGEGNSITPWRMNYKDCNQGIKYPPVAGNAVLFYSMRPNGELEEHSMHGGCPVLKDEKWGANLWLWSKAFISRYGDFERNVAIAEEEQWQLRQDPFLAAEDGESEEGTFLYCPNTGRAIAWPTGTVQPGSKTPKIGSRCTGTLSIPTPVASTSPQTHPGEVEVTVLNDMKPATEIVWSSQTLVLQPGQMHRALATPEDELAVVKKGKGRRPRPLRFNLAHGRSQTVLLSTLLSKGSKGGAARTSKADL